MTRHDTLNGTAAVIAIALSLGLGLHEKSSQAPTVVEASEPAASIQVVHRDGNDGVLDASGSFVPLGHYTRIAATSALASQLLLELCEPDRIAAFAPASGAPDAYRYAGKPRLSGASDLEALLHLEPDLVLIHAHLAGGGRLERMREAGLRVFDLGAMRGLASLQHDLRVVGLLVGRPEMGAELAQRVGQRVARIASTTKAKARPAGIYLALYGDALLGGTLGTSYHEVLEAGGVHDIAAERYRDWPRYDPEAVLELNPRVIVTGSGMGHAICALPGLASVDACAERRVIELDRALLDDPGFGMPLAAESLHDALVRIGARGAE